MTKQDYSLLLGGNSDDDDDDFVLPPVFAGKGKSAGKRARSPNMSGLIILKVDK